MILEISSFKRSEYATINTLDDRSMVFCDRLKGGHTGETTLLLNHAPSFGFDKMVTTVSWGGWTLVSVSTCVLTISRVAHVGLLLVVEACGALEPCQARVWSGGHYSVLRGLDTGQCEYMCTYHQQGSPCRTAVGSWSPWGSAGSWSPVRPGYVLVVVVTTVSWEVWTLVSVSTCVLTISRVAHVGLLLVVEARGALEPCQARVCTSSCGHYGVLRGAGHWSVCVHVYLPSAG